MQTSLARRQRHRRGANRRPRGGAATRRVALALPIALFSALLTVGFVAFLAAVSAYSYYSRGLPDPKALLTNITFDQQTIVYDRTGALELARLGEHKREVVRFADLPEELIDATTAIEDKDFWTNPGFDFAGFVSASLDTISGRPRGGSTITQQLVRNRLLPPELLEGSVYDRKIREIIQSVRLTQEFEGEQGKKEILTAYLNQNFYGNQSYGVKAAALSYFGKALDDLTLAEAAILAAIPQSPTKFDLLRNAERECSVEIAEDAECPADKVRLVVPQSAEVVVRRDHILDLMKTRSVLSGDRHTRAEYDRAKREEVVLARQGREPWKAAHFVWQVREQLAAILCPGETADNCTAVDTGGYKVTTSLDYDMQRIGERFVFAASRVPNLRNPEAHLEAQQIPREYWDFILDMRGANIHNGAAAVIDYRTGEVLAYVGSGGYHIDGNAQFDPQFDVLSDGWRQPGSAIKPLNYLVGLHDRTMTAATLFMDVVTDFGNDYTPTQADGLERGPVRLRPALQFSLNVPSIKAGLMNGLDHVFERTKDFGLRYDNGAIPVTSMGIGTVEVHPIDLLGAYGAIANNGTLAPRTMLLEVRDAKNAKIWPTVDTAPKGKRVASEQAAFIVTDILAGNTIPEVNPYWAEWAIYDGDTRRPAAYKTGTTNDNKDVHAYGYLAPPADPEAPALAVGVWMGNSNSDPNTDTLSLGSSAPLWSAIMTEVSKGTPVAGFAESRPDGLVTAEVDAVTGYLPGPFTSRTVEELFIEGTVPTRRDDFRIALDIDAASGLRWQDGCVGPMVTRGFLDLRDAEPAFPAWQEYTLGWLRRAARGTGVPGGPENTRTSWFYNGSFLPFGRGWGSPFAPSGTCEPAPPEPSCGPDENAPPIGLPGASGEPEPEPEPCPTEEPDDGDGDDKTLPPQVTPKPKPSKPPKP